MYICMCVYIYIYIYIYVYVCVCVCLCVYMYMCVRVCSLKLLYINNNCLCFSSQKCYLGASIKQKHAVIYLFNYFEAIALRHIYC